MDTLAAFNRAEAARRSGKTTRNVFDWHKAARLIRDRKPTEAGAGLRDDWEYTGGSIYRDGKPIGRDETYVYLASIWATPEIDLDGIREDCLLVVGEDHEWNSGTYWPESALAILRGEAE